MSKRVSIAIDSSKLVTLFNSAQLEKWEEFENLKNEITQEYSELNGISLEKSMMEITKELEKNTSDDDVPFHMCLISDDNRALIVKAFEETDTELLEYVKDTVKIKALTNNRFAYTEETADRLARMAAKKVMVEDCVNGGKQVTISTLYENIYSSVFEENDAEKVEVVKSFGRKANKILSLNLSIPTL